MGSFLIECNYLSVLNKMRYQRLGKQITAFHNNETHYPAIRTKSFFFLFFAGTCRDQINNFSCICDVGYMGRHCDAVITKCSNDSCYPGVPCMDKTVPISCGPCPSGFTGNGKNCRGTTNSTLLEYLDLNRSGWDQSNIMALFWHTLTTDVQATCCQFAKTT